MTGVSPTDARQAVGRGTVVVLQKLAQKAIPESRAKQAEGRFLPSTFSKVAMQTWSPKN